MGCKNMNECMSISHHISCHTLVVTNVEDDEEDDGISWSPDDDDDGDGEDDGSGVYEE